MNSTYPSRKFLFKGVLKSWPASYPASVNLYDHLGFACNGDGQPRNTPPDPCQGEGLPFQNVRALPSTEVAQIYPAIGNLYDDTPPQETIPPAVPVIGP